MARRARWLSMLAGPFAFVGLVGIVLAFSVVFMVAAGLLMLMFKALGVPF